MMKIGSRAITALRKRFEQKYPGTSGFYQLADPDGILIDLSER